MRQATGCRHQGKVPFDLFGGEKCISRQRRIERLGLAEIASDHGGIIRSGMAESSAASPALGIATFRISVDAARRAGLLEVDRRRDQGSTQGCCATDRAWASWCAGHTDDNKRKRPDVVLHHLGLIPYRQIATPRSTLQNVNGRKVTALRNTLSNLLRRCSDRCVATFDLCCNAVTPIAEQSTR